MIRSRDAQVAQRINWAWKRLDKQVSRTQVASALARRFSISSRQAYRYLRSAESITRPLAIPEPKTVFSVKVPLSLMNRTRRRASQSKASVSDTVTQALEEFLKRHWHG